MTGTSHRAGRIVWRDLMSTDVQASRRFHCELLGWQADDMDLGDLGVWALLRDARGPVARVVPFEAAGGLSSHWTHYVSQDDVEAACSRATRAGGSVCSPPFDGPDLGRFALLADPGQGLTKPLHAPEGDPPFDASPGRLVWDVLLTPDRAAAARFYERLYGWTHWPDPAGNAIFMTDGEGVASVLVGVPGPTANAWVPCARVSSVDEALARAAGLGAAPVGAPRDLPSVGRCAIVRDPAGALLGLLAPSKIPAPVPQRFSTRTTRVPRPVTPAPSLTAREAFARIAERFDPAAAAGVAGVVQYELRGPDGGSWHVVLGAGAVRAHEGLHPAPTVTLTLSASDYVDLARGVLRGPQAVASGRMTISGDASLALQLGRILRPLVG